MSDRDEFIAGLRELADRLERHPDCGLPFVAPHLSIYCHSEDTFAASVRAIGGTKTVDAQGNIGVETKLAGLPVGVRMLGEVCELVEVGTEEYDDIEVVTEAVTRTVRKTRPVYERRCPESLLALAEDGAA